MKLLSIVLLITISFVCASVTETEYNYYGYNYNTCPEECEELVVYEPLEVEIGVYITQITDVDPDLGTFFAVGYYWVIWPTWYDLV